MFKLRSLKLLICMFAFSIQQNCEAVPNEVSYVGANWTTGNTNNWRFKLLQDFHNLKPITPGNGLATWPNGAEKTDMENDVRDYGAAKGSGKNPVPVEQRSYSNNQNGIEKNKKTQTFLTRRVLLSEVDFDTLQRGANTSQKFENKVYTVKEDGTLEFNNETISSVISTYFGNNDKNEKGRSSLLLHCVQSTPDAILREIASSQLLSDMSFKVTPLLFKLINTYSSKAPELFKEFKSKVINSFQDLAQDVSNVDIEAPFDVVPEVIKVINKNNTRTFLSKVLTELKEKISLIDFALIFRLDDGVIHVGIIPLFASDDANVSAVLNQFDNNGLLKATQNFVRESRQPSTRQDQDDTPKVRTRRSATRISL